MGKRTVLYAQHETAGAKLVDFAGWDMPLHYRSQIQEHHAVRQDSGLFDVSHMLAIDISGKNSLAYLSYLLANNPQKLKPGKALYSCLLNDEAGILDDLIVYQLSEQRYRIVVNAGNREQDLNWFNQQAERFSDLRIEERHDLSILAIQGPNARQKSLPAFNETQHALIENLKPFHCVEQNNWCVARTGYTGEDGFEVMLPQNEAKTFWQRLLALGIPPCGLGARDTLRLEAGFNLHGSDMDISTTPLESNLAWTIDWEPSDRDFIGREALTQQRNQLQRELYGLVLEERAILRKDCVLTTEKGDTGHITSASYAPSLACSIALARLPLASGDYCHVTIRDKNYRAKIIKPPFIRKGKKAFE
ncbi:glycine cleavage system aminomethyltransferase GcvT [Rickettsiella endosymbiont of Dermanyssus gallinae]|uniref:glycine cleavage system aminomethyltransferase GcvT n=1 Tax=Rickettsiella endosymbiont of Dermanyssus gallinae TaxID=2856608 RepID=UPI001C5292A5|nr:glycine cleavage system aminomethyltransferase GcvT [Rickettsiella endosymbiont of Dermanyssus gallinae]